MLKCQFQVISLEASLYKLQYFILKFKWSFKKLIFNSSHKINSYIGSLSSFFSFTSKSSNFIYFFYFSPLFSPNKSIDSSTCLYYTWSRRSIFWGIYSFFGFDIIFASDGEISFFLPSFFLDFTSFFVMNCFNYDYFVSL